MFSRARIAGVFCSILGAANLAVADVRAFSGESGAKLYIQHAPALAADAYIVKFEGRPSAWAGKPIKVQRQERPSSTRYVFEYEEKRGSRMKKLEYQMILGEGWELYYPEAPPHEKPLRFHRDEKLTEQSRKVDLVGEYKRSPYLPVVPKSP